MKSSQKLIKLNNGLDMPAVALGTDPAFTTKMFEQAIKEAGYTHIDTASYYKNEEAIGGIWAKGIKREDIWLTSKVWMDEVEDVEAACRRSMEKLKTDYLDLYLIHWPVAVKMEKPDGRQTTTYAFLPNPIHKTWA